MATLETLSRPSAPARPVEPGAAPKTWTIRHVFSMGSTNSCLVYRVKGDLTFRGAFVSFTDVDGRYMTLSGNLDIQGFAGEDWR